VLILDEPTDGFGKEQLASVREALDKVECQQVIVVP
jgi:DNA repair exonuclease SbcCD ATPase subunit